MSELLFHGTSLGEINDLVQILGGKFHKKKDITFKLRLNVKNGINGQQVLGNAALL